MLQRLISLIDRLLGISGNSPRDLALVEERLAALQPRMPWIYAMMLSCAVGQMLTFELQHKPPALTLILCTLASLRGLMWLRMRRQHLVGEAARQRLRMIGIGSVLGTLAFAVVIGQILPSLSPERTQLMMVMAATCAIAMSAPMSIMPRTAMITYFLFGIPAAAIGMVAGPDRAATVAAFNLLLCNFILISLLRIQSRSFVGRIDARLEGQFERARAEHAERIAI